MDKKEAIELFINKECADIHLKIKYFNDNLKKGGSKNVLTYEKLIDTLQKPKYNLKELSISANSITKLISILFPNKPKSTGKVCNYLFLKYDHKYCTKCNKVKHIKNFNDNIFTSSGKNNYCKICHTATSATTQTHRTAKYKASKVQRTPKWETLEQVTMFYKNCPKDKVVDHIVPLNGVNVCGLHTIYNLQYLTNSENCSKNNKF